MEAGSRGRARERPPGGASAFDLALRASLLPLFLGLRLVRGGLSGADTSLPSPRRGLALAAKVALDEIFLCSEVLSAPVVAPSDFARLGRELRRALELAEREGWSREPARYHRTPEPIREPEVRAVASWLGPLRRLRFESGYEPNPGEPGRTRWLGYRANRTARAWLLAHPGAPRPWVVCVPGYRMGHPLVDFTGFRVRWLYGHLGVNVAIPLLPLHGPRSVGTRGGDGFLRGDFVDTLHAQAQAVWDVRRLVGWLRQEGAPAVGAHGVSLGAYTTALLATLEPLDCVVAGVPTTDFVGLLRAHMPRFAQRLLEAVGVDFAALEQLLRPISPLAMAPLVAPSRRFLYAGAADRLAPPHHALALWRHWGHPPIAWYEGGHVSFLFERDVKRLIRTALERSGFLEPRPLPPTSGR
jgi:hypothetical protein